MKRRSVLTPEAEADLDEAFTWYEEQLPGLGSDFVAAVQNQLELVADNPSQYQEAHRGIRRAILRRFPYAIFYLSEDDRVVVLAVEHQARDPDHWKKRL